MLCRLPRLSCRPPSLVVLYMLYTHVCPRLLPPVHAPLTDFRLSTIYTPSTAFNRLFSTRLTITHTLALKQCVRLSPVSSPLAYRLSPCVLLFHNGAPSPSPPVSLFVIAHAGLFTPSVPRLLACLIARLSLACPLFIILLNAFLLSPCSLGVTC